jgi:hypothetical protein
MSSSSFALQGDERLEEGSKTTALSQQKAKSQPMRLAARSDWLYAVCASAHCSAAQRR